MSWLFFLSFYTGNMNLVLLLSGLLFGSPNTNLEVDLEVQQDHTPIQQDTSFIQKWEQYKQEYGKVYGDFEEELRAQIAFQKNDLMIEEHNRLYEQGQISYSLGHNQFSDLSPDEDFSDDSEHTTVQYNPSTLKYEDEDWPSIGTYEAIDHSTELIPSFVDWRREGAVTNVKREGHCQASWAFSATGALEGQLFRSTNHLETLSEQNLVDCVSKLKHNSCKTGSVIKAFQYIQKNGGIDNNATYPWKGKQNFFCHYKSLSNNPTVHGIAVVRHGNETALAASVAKSGPVSVAVDARSNKFKFYKNGIYENRQCSSRVLTRAMLVVGYSRTAWILKNSWGRKWGVGGYMFLKRGGNQCGVASKALYPIV